jgi:hypothetical protein
MDYILDNNININIHNCKCTDNKFYCFKIKLLNNCKYKHIIYNSCPYFKIFIGYNKKFDLINSYTNCYNNIYFGRIFEYLLEMLLINNNHFHKYIIIINIFYLVFTNKIKVNEYFVYHDNIIEHLKYILEYELIYKSHKLKGLLSKYFNNTISYNIDIIHNWYVLLDNIIEH